MAQPPFDFRPNVQIGPKDFIRPTDPWGSLMGGINTIIDDQKKKQLIDQIGALMQGKQPQENSGFNTIGNAVSKFFKEKLLKDILASKGGQEQPLQQPPAQAVPEPTLGDVPGMGQSMENPPPMSMPPMPGQGQPPAAPQGMPPMQAPPQVPPMPTSPQGMPPQAAGQAPGMASPMMGTGLLNPAIVKPLLSLYGEKALPFIGRMMRPPTGKSGQTYQAIVGSDGSVRPFTGTEQIKPGERVVELTGTSYTGALTKQAQRKEALDRYEAMMAQKTNQAMLPFEGAERTLQRYKDLYTKAVEAKEVGPGIGRVGGPTGAVVGGKKFAKLFEYQRTKQELLHTLATSLGVNRFNLAAMQQIASALPEGTEDPKQGIKLIDSMIDSVHKRRDDAKRDLQYQGLILRGIMGLDPAGMGATAAETERPPEAYSDEELERIAAQGE